MTSFASVSFCCGDLNDAAFGGSPFLMVGGSRGFFLSMVYLMLSTCSVGIRRLAELRRIVILVGAGFTWLL